MTFDEWYLENRTAATGGLIVNGMTFEEWLSFAWRSAIESTKPSVKPLAVLLQKDSHAHPNPSST